MPIAPSNKKTIENMGAEPDGLAPSSSLRRAPGKKRRMMSPRGYLPVDWARPAVAIVVVAGLCAVFLLLPSLPPRTIVLATGPKGGAYAEVGLRYREILGRSGIEVTLQPTGGDFENLEQLRDPHSEVSVGFIQGGSTTQKETPNLVSLGSVFYEPLWLFYRRGLQVEGLHDLRGRKVSIGPEGSGTRVLSLELLGRNGIAQDTFVPLALSDMTPYFQTASTVGFVPKAVVDPNSTLYTSRTIQTANSVPLPPVWTALGWYPFELAKQNPAAQQLISIFKKEGIDVRGNLNYLIGWSAWLLFAKSATACGSSTMSS